MASIQKTIKRVKRFLGKPSEESVRLGLRGDPRKAREFVRTWLKNGKKP